MPRIVDAERKEGRKEGRREGRRVRKVRKGRMERKKEGR